MRTVLLSLLGLLLAMPAAAQPRVGVTGAVNPQAESTPPALASRTLFIGAELVMRERIRTGEAGTVQVVFVDRSTLAVGRNSDITIDEFVYSPATDTGRMATTLTRGVLRYVGGRISHRDGVTVETPAGTIGIRGGTALISIVGSATQVLNIFGNVMLSNAAGSTRIIRPGFIAEMRSRNDAPGEARQASLQEITQVMSLTDSGPGQGGGAPSPPTDAGARNAGTGQRQAGLEARQVQPQSPQGSAAQPLSASSSNGLRNGLRPSGGDPTLYSSIQTAQQNDIVQTNFGGFIGFGSTGDLTTLGDLRSASIPQTLNFSQSNVPIVSQLGNVGSYNFVMQITLGSNAAARGITATASNINVSGPNWGAAPVTGATLSFGSTLAAPNFGGLPDPFPAGFGATAGCATNVTCSFSAFARNGNGRIANAVDHAVVVFTTPPASPAVAVGGGTVVRP
jgi:hypothetical protein